MKVTFGNKDKLARVAVEGDSVLLRIYEAGKIIDREVVSEDFPEQPVLTLEFKNFESLEAIQKWLDRCFQFRTYHDVNKYMAEALENKTSNQSETEID